MIKLDIKLVDKTITEANPHTQEGRANYMKQEIEIQCKLSRASSIAKSDLKYKDNDYEYFLRTVKPEILDEWYEYVERFANLKVNTDYDYLTLGEWLK